MKRIAIHQPNFLPWLGYFYKMQQCDTFILLDDVQVSTSCSGSYFSQTFIKTQNPNRLQISLPQKKHSIDTMIRDVKFSENYNSFCRKFFKTLELSYHKAPFFKKHYENIVNIMQNKYEYIWQMNSDLIRYCASQLNVKCEILIASNFCSEKQNEARIIDLVLQSKGSVYISGSGASNYQKDENFTKAGIKLIYSDFKIKPYSQINGDFVGGLSVIDYLFNVIF